MRVTTQFTVSLQNDGSSRLLIIRVRASSMIVLFVFSASPFCCGQNGADVCISHPSLARISQADLFVNSNPFSRKSTEKKVLLLL